MRNKLFPCFWVVVFLGFFFFAVFKVQRSSRPFSHSRSGMHVLSMFLDFGYFSASRSCKQDPFLKQDYLEQQLNTSESETFTGICRR